MAKKTTKTEAPTMWEVTVKMHPALPELDRVFYFVDEKAMQSWLDHTPNTFGAWSVRKQYLG